jgi:2-polyprenyl-3-methyl-5-hydroxy-6-metoxy-1,4-benzoquinol methylase
MRFDGQHALIYKDHINESIFHKIPVNTKILDIGCNAGKLGEKLIRQKNCQVWGVDNSKQAIKEASKVLTKAEYFNIESGKIPFEREKFEVIIFGDVLEHLRWPNTILNNVSNILDKNGEIIASIPNIANIKIRIKLLLGSWNYTKDGILDETHLRFFTKKSILKLFDDENYKVIELDITPGLNLWSINMNYNICKLWPTLLAKQFIIKAIKK